MGFNSTFMILNDELHKLREVENLGEKISQSISLRPVDDWESPLPQGIRFIETHHADGNAIISAGGNCAQVLGYTFCSNNKENIPEMLKQLADEYGYRLIKKKK